MNPLRALLLLCLGLTGLRAGIETQGLPDGAVGLVYISNEAFQRTVFGRAFDSAFRKEMDANVELRNLEEKVGIRPRTDIREAVIGAYASKKPEGDPTVVGLIRGTFNPARIEAFARSNKVPATTVGKHLAWDATALGEAIAGQPSGDPDRKDMVIIAYSKDLLILASKDQAEAAVAAASGKAPSWAGPTGEVKAALQSVTTANTWLLLHWDALKLSKAEDRAKIEEDGFQEFSFAIGEDAKNLQLRLSAHFKDDASTTMALLQLKLLPTTVDAALTVAAAGKSPAEVAQLEKLSDLIRQISFDRTERTITARLDYPAQEVGDALRSAIQKAAAGK